MSAQGVGSIVRRHASVKRRTVWREGCQCCTVCARSAPGEGLSPLTLRGARRRTRLCLSRCERPSGAFRRFLPPRFGTHRAFCNSTDCINRSDRLWARRKVGVSKNRLLLTAGAPDRVFRAHRSGRAFGGQMPASGVLRASLSRWQPTKALTEFAVFRRLDHLGRFNLFRL